MALVRCWRPIEGYAGPTNKLPRTLHTKFTERGSTPVLWASSGRPDNREPFLGFSGSWAVASRNRLQRFLALFVATSGMRRPRGAKDLGLFAVWRYRDPKIATPNFRELVF